MAGFPCVSRVLFGRRGIYRSQISVELEIVIDHALGGETIAGASVGEVGISATHLTVGIETADGVGETVGIIGFEIESAVAPDLAEAGNIIGDDGAARERGFKRRQSQWLIARRGGVNHGAAIQCTQLRFGLWTADGYGALIGGGYFHISAYRNARHRNGLLGTHNAH